MESNFYFSINQDPKKKVVCTFRTEHEARFFVDIILFIQTVDNSLYPDCYTRLYSHIALGIY